MDENPKNPPGLEEERTLADARNELREAILEETKPDAVIGNVEELAALDERILNLARAYTLLGGELELGPPPMAPPLDVEAAALAAWRGANDAGATTAQADEAAAAVRRVANGGPA